MAALLTVTSVVSPVFLVAAVGYLFGRLHPGSGTELNAVAFNLFVPALVLQNLLDPTLPLGVLGQVALAAVAIFLGCGALAFALGQRSRGALLTAMTPNNANMGISLCVFAFGEAASPFATAFYATTATLTLTVGLLIASGGMRPGQWLRVPFLHAIAFGLVGRLSGLSLPTPMAVTVDILAAAAIPCMLIVLGHRLSRARFTGVRRSLTHSAIRMVGGTVIGLLCVAGLPVSPLAGDVIVLQAAMPAAVITTVISQQYDAEPEAVASTVAISTLLSVAWVPLVLSFLQAASP